LGEGSENMPNLLKITKDTLIEDMKRKNYLLMNTQDGTVYSAEDLKELIEDENVTIDLHA
jgi:hypothetical protein